MINVDKIDFTTLYDGARELVEMYKQELHTQKVDASGELSKSADFDIDFDEDKIVLYFIYNSYGYYINEGRKPTGSGGGQPWGGYRKSTADIAKWMRDKMARGWFVPRPNQKVPRTEKEIQRVAFAIVRKIHGAGFYSPDHYGLHILQQVLLQAETSGLLDRMVQSVVNGYDKEISVELEKL